MILLGAGTTLVQARDPVADANSLKALHGGDAVVLRNAVLDDLNKKSVTEKDRYVGEEMLGGSPSNGPWAKLLTQTDNPDAQLNAAILIAASKTLSSDAALENIMMPNSNAALRYWGAKGLEGIMPELINVGGAVKTRALDALNKSIAHETSGVVKQEIIRALGAGGDVPALQTAADALAAQLQSGVADHETIDAAGTALSQLDALLKKGATVDKTKVAKSAAWIASFSAQQLRAVAARQADSTNPDATPDIPESFVLSVSNAISNAIAVLNDLVGKGTFAPVHSTSPDEIQFAVDGITGSSSGPGSLQKALPDVPVPPAIKQ